MPAKRDPLRDKIGDLRRRTSARANELRAELRRVTALESALRAAATEGAADELVADTRLPYDVLAELAPYLTLEQTKQLLRRDQHRNLVSLVASRLSSAAVADRALLRDVVIAVGRECCWSLVLRVQMLTIELDIAAATAVARVMAEDAYLAVMLGMALGGRQSAVTRREQMVVARRLVQDGPCRDFYRLGEAFACQMNDPSLELDLIGLLATFPDPETAAKLAAQQPQLRSPSASAIAQRLVDLDIAVSAITATAP